MEKLTSIKGVKPREFDRVVKHMNSNQIAMCKAIEDLRGTSKIVNIGFIHEDKRRSGIVTYTYVTAVVADFKKNGLSGHVKLNISIHADDEYFYVSNALNSKHYFKTQSVESLVSFVVDFLGLENGFSEKTPAAVEILRLKDCFLSDYSGGEVARYNNELGIVISTRMEM